MAVIKKRAEFIGRKVEIFGEEQEQWQADHDRADAYFELQELLGDGIELYEKICRLDDCWHAAVYDNPNVFDQATSDYVLSLFGRWAEITTHVLNITAKMQADYAARGFDMKLIAKLSSSHRACAAILNPSNVETELADTAIELHKVGHLEEM